LRLRFPCKVALDSGDLIHTGFLAFHSILVTLLPTAVLPDVCGFPALTVLRPLRPTAIPSAAGWPSLALARPMSVVPRFRVMSSVADVRLPLYTPTMRSAPATDLRGFHPCNQRHSVTKSTFPRSAPGTVRLSPSLSVSRLARFSMLQARVPLVAIVRLRLAVSGQDRVCPYPHVPRASGCLYLWVHNLPGQPHLRGVVGG
jgi:hypothetical protein